MIWSALTGVAQQTLPPAEATDRPPVTQLIADFGVVGGLRRYAEYRSRLAAGNTPPHDEDRSTHD